MRLFAYLTLTALSCGVAFSQPGTRPPAFEVADVHVSPRSANPAMRGGLVSGGRYELRTATMADLIRVAWGVDTNNVVGGLAWLCKITKQEAVSMPLRSGGRLAFAVLVLAAGAAAQPPAVPGAATFDVVSIRAVPPNAPPVMREQGFTPISAGGGYANSRDSLVFMICFAYDFRNPDHQLIGLPNWAKSQSYAVEAKPTAGLPTLPPAENREQVRLMMRAMLADRFHLQIHTETRQERIYKLGLPRGGFRLKEVDAPVPPATEGHVGAAMRNDGGIRMIATKATMGGFAMTLSLLTGRPVVDDTGVKGYYDFDVSWNGPEPANGQAPEMQFGGPELVGLLISNLQSQFGLGLSSATGPVEYWVVDHVDPPTDN